jgi:hypothetical protein
VVNGKRALMARVFRLLNDRSEFSRGSLGTFVRGRCLIPGSTEEDNMKKFGYLIAALGAIAIAAPSIASAETVIIKRGGDHHRFGARAEFREHRDHGWHHRDKVVIVKHRRGY